MSRRGLGKCLGGGSVLFAIKFQVDWWLVVTILYVDFHFQADLTYVFAFRLFHDSISLQFFRSHFIIKQILNIRSSMISRDENKIYYSDTSITTCSNDAMNVIRSFILNSVSLLLNYNDVFFYWGIHNQV